MSFTGFIPTGNVLYISLLAVHPVVIECFEFIKQDVHTILYLAHSFVTLVIVILPFAVNVDSQSNHLVSFTGLFIILLVAGILQLPLVQLAFIALNLHIGTMVSVQEKPQVLLIQYSHHHVASDNNL